MNHDDVKILNETILFKSFLKIKQYDLQHRLFNGDWSQTISREVLMRERVAAAILYDPLLDKIVLLEQFRPGALKDKNSPWLLEIVAGLMEENETPEQLVHREAKEESGLLVEDLMFIYDYWPSPGGSCERVALYCAKVDASNAGGIHGLKDEQEDIKVHAVDSEIAFSYLQEGCITNAATIIALQWLQLNKDKVQKHWRV